MIPYSRQCIEDDDIAAVEAVLRGDWLTTGPAVEEFEHRLAEKVGAKHAVVVSSGTAALHLALQAAQIGPGHRVATSSISFSASANCARYVGATVELVDIDPTTLNLDVDAVPEVDALVAVHFTGLPINLARLAKRPPVLIEDAAQALGASTPDGPVGNCARSDMTTFSFHPVKSITTGEGGAVTTNDDDLAVRLRALRSHGIIRSDNDELWAYDIPELGHNFRLTDFQSALGTSQLAKLDRFVERRSALAHRYRERLGSIAEITLPPLAPDGFRHAHHLFVVRVPHRRQVYDSMRAAGIGVQVHHVPIHRLYPYRQASACPRADAYYDAALSLPLFPQLSTVDQDLVIEMLKSAITSASLESRGPR